MGMTMTQKILAAHAGLDHVEAGQLIMADLDLVLGNDVTSPVAINEFNKAGFTGVFDTKKITGRVQATISFNPYAWSWTWDICNSYLTKS